MTTINYTKAIANGIISFEEACALQGTGMTEAIREGIIDFEQALQLQTLEETSIVNALDEKVNKPAKTTRKQAKKQETKVEVQAEKQPEKAEQPKEPVYTKGGCLLQWDDEIAAKGTEKATITKGYNSLTKQGFTVTRKRVGTWVEMFQTGEDKRTSKEFAAAKLDSGWKFIKGAWKYPALLAGYEDSFRPEK